MPNATPVGGKYTPEQHAQQRKELEQFTMRIAPSPVSRETQRLLHESGDSSAKPQPEPEPQPQQQPPQPQPQPEAPVERQYAPLAEEDSELHDEQDAAADASVGLQHAPGSVEHTGHNASIYAVAFSPDGSSFFTADTTGKRAIMWDSATSAKIREFTHDDQQRMYGLAVSPDGRHLATASYDDNAAYMFDVEGGQLLQGFKSAPDDPASGHTAGVCERSRSACPCRCPA